MSGYYPILMDLKGRACLIVGGGNVAARKAGSLADAGARVTIVAPQLGDETKALCDAGKAEWVSDVFRPEQMDNATLVIASTDDDEVNRNVYDAAMSRSLPVNVVDQPELCTFIVPSVVRRGDLTIAISTSGKSPAVAKSVRKRLEQEFGEEWGAYLELMGEARILAREKINDQKAREHFFNRLTSSDLFERVQNGEIDDARKMIEEMVES